MYVIVNALPVTVGEVQCKAEQREKSGAMSKYSLSTNGSGVVIQAESASVSFVCLLLPPLENRGGSAAWSTETDCNQLDFFYRYRVIQALLAASTMVLLC